MGGMRGRREKSRIENGEWKERKKGFVLFDMICT